MVTKQKLRTTQGLPANQLISVKKAQAFGWVVSQAVVTNQSHLGEVAVVLTMQGTVGVVYPDGVMDRQTAQKSGGLIYRSGWSDAAEIAAAKELADRRADRALSLLKAFAEEFTRTHNVNHSL